MRERVRGEREEGRGGERKRESERVSQGWVLGMELAGWRL